MRFIFHLFIVALFIPVTAYAGESANEKNIWATVVHSINSPELPEEVSKVLANSSSITLYSLQPWGGPDLPEWDFHGHHQLGHIELKQEKAKQAIDALNETISAGNTHMMSMCLINPRHAIRVTSQNDVYDILICYQCGQLALFKNDKPLPFEGSIGGKPDTFNNLLQEAGIPLADNPAALQKSYAEEAKAATQRAEQGDTKAQELIGKYLMSGRGIEKNETQGIKWLAKAYGTSTDNPDFEVKLGKMLSHSREVKPDFIKAMKLFRTAADKGNAEGQYQVGKLYEDGEGIKMDQAEAMKWFRMAAEQGNPKAQYELGVYYDRGWHVKPDRPEGIKWLRKAAEQGHPDAMYQLGAIYEKGECASKDSGEAFFWYRLAHEYHTVYNERPFDVSSEQKAAAEKRVMEWKSHHPSCSDCQF